MAASAILADSSFYIRLMRQGEDPLRALAAAALMRDVAICGVVRCEVGRALRGPRVRQRFHECWNVMINVPTDNRLWEETEQTLWELDRQGVVLPLTDVVIGCCARRIGAIVLTFDHHFSQIPGIRAIDRLEG
jgi:predicted nucleic acid-binding protein